MAKRKQLILAFLLSGTIAFVLYTAFHMSYTNSTQNTSSLDNVATQISTHNAVTKAQSKSTQCVKTQKKNKVPPTCKSTPKVRPKLRVYVMPESPLQFSDIEDNFISQNELAFEKMPNISLFARMPATAKYKKIYFCILLRSISLFWAVDFGPLVLVLDDESKEDHKLGDKLLKNQQLIPINIKIKYEKLPKDKSVLSFAGSPKSPNYNRQLWSSFFNDLYVDTKIIAWMGTDSTLITPVTTFDIFDGKKIRVIGQDKFSIGWVRSWGITTELALGLPQVADFMVYFPVFIWTDTYRNCREFILKRFKTTNFETAFKQIYHTGHANFISPVSVVLSYAWYFERDRYDWHFELLDDLKTYNKRLPEKYKLTEEHTRPFYLTALHATYDGNYMKQGYCLTYQVTGDRVKGCKKFENTSHTPLFYFGYGPYTYCLGKEKEKICKTLLAKHYTFVAKHYASGKRKRPNIADLKTIESLSQKIGNVTCSEMKDTADIFKGVQQGPILSS